MKDLQSEFIAQRDAEARMGLAARGTCYLEDIDEGQRFDLSGKVGTVTRKSTTDRKSTRLNSSHER